MARVDLAVLVWVSRISICLVVLEAITEVVKEANGASRALETMEISAMGMVDIKVKCNPVLQYELLIYI